MLSTTHTLTCPTCGQAATIRMHTVRHRPNTPRSSLGSHVSFTCRRGCVLAAEQIVELCELDATG